MRKCWAVGRASQGGKRISCPPTGATAKECLGQRHAAQEAPGPGPREGPPGSDAAHEGRARTSGAGGPGNRLDLSPPSSSSFPPLKTIRTKRQGARPSRQAEQRDPARLSRVPPSRRRGPSGRPRSHAHRGRRGPCRRGRRARLGYGEKRAGRCLPFGTRVGPHPPGPRSARWAAAAGERAPEGPPGAWRRGSRLRTPASRGRGRRGQRARPPGAPGRRPTGTRGSGPSSSTARSVRVAPSAPEDFGTAGPVGPPPSEHAQPVRTRRRPLTFTRRRRPRGAGGFRACAVGAAAPRPLRGGAALRWGRRRPKRIAPCSWATWRPR